MEKETVGAKLELTCRSFCEVEFRKCENVTRRSALYKGYHNGMTEFVMIKHSSGKPSMIASASNHC